MLSLILGVEISMQWLWIAGIVAGLQIVSPVTRFCPVYFVLNKLIPTLNLSKAVVGSNTPGFLCPHKRRSLMRISLIST